MEQWKIQFTKQLYFYETTIDDFHSVDLLEFLKEHSEIANEVKEFTKWLAEEELIEDFKKWLDKRDCLDMFEYCMQ